jgi:hypothetical protein
MTQTHTLIDARPGDVLMSMGKSGFSKIIAWNCDCDYSHVAVVHDDGVLIEASLDNVRIVPLEQRRKDVASYSSIDVWRADALEGNPLSDHNKDALRMMAKEYLNRPYPTDMLLELAVAVAVRQKLPQNPIVRFVVRLALDRLIKNSNNKVMCSELAYRMFAEGPYDPPKLLAPLVAVTEPSHRPFPDIDWGAFYKEMEHVFRPKATLYQAQSSSAQSSQDLADLRYVMELNNVVLPRPQMATGAGISSSGFNLELLSDSAMQELIDRAGFSVNSANSLAANPKMITPGDFTAVGCQYSLIGAFMEPQAGA